MRYDPLKCSRLIPHRFNDIVNIVVNLFRLLFCKIKKQAKVSFHIPGDRLDMRVASRHSDGARASVRGLVDGSRLAPGTVHALHRP